MSLEELPRKPEFPDRTAPRCGKTAPLPESALPRGVELRCVRPEHAPESFHFGLTSDDGKPGTVRWWAW